MESPGTARPTKDLTDPSPTSHRQATDKFSGARLLIFRGLRLLRHGFDSRWDHQGFPPLRASFPSENSHRTARSVGIHQGRATRHLPSRGQALQEERLRRGPRHRGMIGGPSGRGRKPRRNSRCRIDPWRRGSHERDETASSCEIQPQRSGDTSASYPRRISLLRARVGIPSAILSRRRTVEMVDPSRFPRHSICCFIPRSAHDRLAICWICRQRAARFAVDVIKRVLWVAGPSE